MKDLIGKTLGNYQIEAEIGHGGMATVFKAHQPGLNRSVAVKVMLSALTAQDSDFALRFQREAEAIARLNHPNILPVYDFGITDDYNFIVMRYVAGGQTLRTEMRRQLSLTEAVNFMEQIANALTYAHQQGVIHRDLKPDNVLLDNEWALLADFGLAKIADASLKLSRTGDVMGTPLYMSPEQLIAEPIDQRTDVYALGIILYQILTGIIPHNADTPITIAIKRSQEAPQPLRTINPNISKDVEAIVLQTLAINPADRFDTTFDFLTALKQAVKGRAVQQKQATPSSSPPISDLEETQPTIMKDLPVVEAKMANPRLIPLQAPPEIPYFVGRQEKIKQLKSLLMASSQIKPIGLCGYGGSGKSALAIHLAHQLRDHFKDGILWAQLDATNLGGVLLNFAGAFAQQEAMAETIDLQAKIALLRQILSGKHLLIILDHAEESEQVKALSFSDQTISTLITTRNRKLLININADIHEVNPFNQAQGLALLERFVGPERLSAEMEAAQQVVDLVGGLPLALSIVGGSLAEAEDLAIGEYKEELEDEQARLEHLFDWEDESKNVSASFELSYKRLPPPIQKVFSALSVFGGPSFSAEAVAAVTNLTSFKAKTALGRLQAYSLLEGSLEEQHNQPADKPSKKGRYRLHPLLKLFAQSKSEGDADDLFERAAVYFANLAEKNGLQGYELLDFDWENVMNAVHWAYQNQRWDILNQAMQSLTEINLGVIGFLDARGYWNEARQGLTWALRGLEVKSDPLVKAQILTKLGAFAVRQADFATAADYLGKSHQLFDQLPASNDTLLPRARLYEFKSRLLMNTDRQTAMAWIKRGLNELKEATPGLEQYEKGYLLIQLSGILGRMGEFDEAIEAVEAGLALLPEGPTSARISGLTNLSTIYGILGQSAKSIGYIKEGINLAQALGDYPRLATQWRNLAIEAEYSGDNLAKAIEPYQKALDLYQQMGDIRRAGHVHSNLGLCYIRLGEDTAAKDQLEQAINIAESNHFTDLEGFAKTNLANLQLRRGELSAVAPTLTRAYEICLALELSELAEVLYLQAELALANKAYDTATDLVDSAIQTAHNPLQKGVAWRIKASIFQAQAQLEQAELSFQESINLLTNQDPYELGKSQVALAQYFLSNQTSDTTTIKTLLQASLTTFKALDAKYDLNHAKVILADLTKK